jgi:cytochrome c biogenesis factor
MALGNLLLLLAMGAVTVVLVIGILLMARGGEANRKYGNKLMMMRVVLQAVALAILAVLFAMQGK